MDPPKTHAKLRYRFAALAQARAHVHAVGERGMFFFARAKPILRPGTPVFLELCFDGGQEPTRLLHGTTVTAVEGRGTWIDLADTRPIRELTSTGYTRQHRRMGCDILVELRGEGRVESGHMLELSGGGARIRGPVDLLVNERVELRLLSADRKTSGPLSAAFVAWAETGEIGVRFDRLDSISRTAAARLVAQTEAEWSRALEATHPPGCCGAEGPLDPPLPEGAALGKPAPE